MRRLPLKEKNHNFTNVFYKSQNILEKANDVT